MTLNEAIAYAEEVARSEEAFVNQDGYQAFFQRHCDCAAEHRQLAVWLRELKELRAKQPKVGKWIEHSFSEDGKARLIECSECGAAYVVNCLCDYSIFVEERKYCNKCGAKMN